MPTNNEKNVRPLTGDQPETEEQALPVEQPVADEDITADLLPSREDSPIVMIAKEKIKELQELNPHCKLDLVNVFSRLKLNSKGQFIYELGGKEFNLTDSVNVQILATENEFQLWDSNENTLICKSEDHVISCNGELCAECSHYKEDCKIRSIMVLKVLADGEEDDLFIHNLPTTGTYAFWDYIKLLKKLHKIGVHNCSTRMYTVEKPSKEDSNKKYNAVLFEFANNLK